jgi:3-(3-hydroxy-phenyl)propionate hydroxylase
MEEPRRHIAALMTGLDIHYDLGEGHPLLGRRMPDLELATTEGTLHVYELLHDAKPLLLNLGAPGSVDIAGWADRVRLTDARNHGEWDLPVIGLVSTPTAVLVRPDGYVGWVGCGAPQGLPEALTTWFGPPTAT